MKPLIEIRSIPISVEYKFSDAKLERMSSKTDLEVTRDKRGGLTMKSKPIQLKLDSFEARNSVTQTTSKSIEELPELGKMAALEATARFAEEGDLLLNVHLNSDPVVQNIENRIDNTKSTNIKFIPDRPVNINWIPSDLSIDYEMDKLNFDWVKNKGEFKFIPANIEIHVKEYPKIIIEYIGDPIYVPPSASPNYEHIDEKV